MYFNLVAELVLLVLLLLLLLFLQVVMRAQECQKQGCDESRQKDSSTTGRVMHSQSMRLKPSRQLVIPL